MLPFGYGFSVQTASQTVLNSVSVYAGIADFDLLDEFSEFGVPEIVAFADLHIFETVRAEFYHQVIEARPGLRSLQPRCWLQFRVFQTF